MADVQTERLLLHPIDVAEAERIISVEAGPSDAWAHDFPFEGDITAAEHLLRVSVELGEQRPFGYYRISRRSDGRAIGGVGFTGPPVGGTVELGYGLVPSARGQGYAVEAVAGLVTVALDRGLTTVTAETTLANVASQRTLVRAGFQLVGTNGDVRRYEMPLELASDT